MKKFLSAVVIALLMLSLLATPAAASNRHGSSAWNVPGDFATIQEAIDSPDVAAGDVISVARGNFAGALVTKAVSIMGNRNTVINSGPAHGSGMSQGFRLLAGSDGTKISNLRFEVDLAIMNGAAVADVSVERCTFINPVQAVTNWGGCRWKISNNVITDLKTRNGGGIGILIGDWAGRVVEGNEITNNKITGTLYVGGWYPNPASEQGGYNGSGIVLYADFRWGYAGAAEIKNNRITNNKVSMVSNNPALIDIAAFEMTDSRDDTSLHIIYDNTVTFNDFRGTNLQIDLTPDNLGDFNNISRNFGENRGHDRHDGHNSDRHDGNDQHGRGGRGHSFD
jgi:hypothetical protein